MKMKRSVVTMHQERVRRQLQAAGVILSPSELVEIADFGLGRFEQLGLGLVVRINEPEYCSKWLTLYAGQKCVRHYHKLKKETFFVLSGDVTIDIDVERIHLAPGDSYTLAPGTPHAFWSEAGAVVEEVSTHDENSDSYFDDPAIVRAPIIEED
jgi:D-lyxose ketol-isomerase